MPPILIGQQGDQLLFQNEDGSTFPVAASGLSPDYMNQLASGAQAPSPQDQLLNQLSQNTGGMSSITNPGQLDSAAQNAWQNDLLKRGPANITADELSSFNAAKTQGAPVAFPGQELGTNIQAAPLLEQPKIQELPMAPSVEAVPAKETPSSIEKAFSQQAKGIQKEADAQAEAAKTTAQKYKEASDEYLATQAKMVGIQEEGQKQSDERMKKISEAQAAYEKMEIKNPWSEMSAGSKIGAALAIGLGAYSSGILGGPNQAYKIIDDAINRDVDIQMKQIDKKGKELAHDKDYLSLIKQATNDKSSQALMLKDLKLAAVENQIKGIAENSKSNEVQAKAQQLLGGLSLKRQEFGLDLAQKQANLGKTIAESTAAMGGKPELQVPGLGSAFASQDATNLRQLKTDVEGASRGIERLLKISSMSAKSLTPELRREADTLRSTLQGQLRTALVGPGAVNESERALMERAIADPTAFFSLDSTNKKALETLKSALSNKIESAAQSQIQGYKTGSYKAPQIVTLDKGAQFQIENGQPIPLNDAARQIIEAKKAASSGK